MSFIEETWQRTADIVAEIYQHPFVTELGDGSLDRAKFLEYMSQDGLYLAEYARVLAALAAQAPTADEIVFWSSAARDSILVERELHASHTELDQATPSPTCLAYTSYLKNLTTTGNYRVAAAGVLPCFWIYAEVGNKLLATAGELSSHNYGDWIALYGDPAFADQVRLAKNIVDQAAETASLSEQEQMHTAYATAARYEWMFFDAAWRLETWPV